MCNKIYSVGLFRLSNNSFAQPSAKLVIAFYLPPFSMEYLNKALVEQKNMIYTRLAHAKNG
jgi:hypothetical protein